MAVVSGLREEFEREGFVVVETGLPDAVLDAARTPAGPLQPREYHWNPEGRRVFEGWKTSDAARAVAWSRPVLDAIREVRGLASDRAGPGSDPLPLQTITFDRPSNQRLHQDAVHFDTWPLRGMMMGAWVALQDCGPENGSLCYVPGTHRMQIRGWQEMGFRAHEVGEQYDDYALYEDRMEDEASRWGWKVPVRARKGQAFLWGLEMLHGGYPVKDLTLSRHSMVTHYALPGCGRLWAPMFSDPGSGLIHWKKGRWFDRQGRLHDLAEAAS